MNFIKNAIFLVLFFNVSSIALADCVYGAKDKTKYEIVNSHTLILKGGYGRDILITSYAFFYNTSEITVLKDSFCDYENAALYVDGEPVDINNIKLL